MDYALGLTLGLFLVGFFGLVSGVVHLVSHVRDTRARPHRIRANLNRDPRAVRNLNRDYRPIPGTVLGAGPRTDLDAVALRNSFRNAGTLPQSQLDRYRVAYTGPRPPIDCEPGRGPVRSAHAGPGHCDLLSCGELSRVPALSVIR